MVQYYTIAGRQVGSHVLSMAVLGTTFLGSYLAIRSPKADNIPPINAKSAEEEKFVRDFIKDKESKSS